jgi:hypothetical protein
MSQANIAIVQSLYAAFLRGDVTTVVHGAAPDIHWEIVGRREDYPLLGVRSGHAAMQEFFASLAQLQDVSEFTPLEFDATGDKVFVRGRSAMTIRRSGQSVASEWCHIFTLRDGKVTRFQEFTDTAQYAEAYR